MKKRILQSTPIRRGHKLLLIGCSPPFLLPSITPLNSRRTNPPTTSSLSRLLETMGIPDAISQVIQANAMSLSHHSCSLFKKVSKEETGVWIQGRGPSLGWRDKTGGLLQTSGMVLLLLTPGGPLLMVSFPNHPLLLHPQNKTILKSMT